MRAVKRLPMQGDLPAHRCFNHSSDIRFIPIAAYKFDRGMFDASETGIEIIQASRTTEGSINLKEIHTGVGFR